MSSKSKELDDVKISKRLSYLLRHGAVREGLHIKATGFVRLEEVLEKIPRCTLSDIQRIVKNNDKKRFTLQKDDGVLYIKANQGHTLKEISQLTLKPITNPTFDIIHGTYLNNWKSIKEQGLSRMNRNHVHFAKGLNFICGLRRSAEVFIFINFHKAAADGLKFFESENEVVLSPGNEAGIVEPKYFLKVTNKNNDIVFLN